MACRAEVELNRRLARDVYLGAVPLSVSDKRLAIGEGAMTVDWLVKMRRLNEGRMFDNLIARNQADRHCLDAIVLKISDFYRRANAASWAPMPYLKQWKLNLQQNRGVLLDRRFGLAQAPTRYCDRMLQQFLRRWTFLLLSRLRHGVFRWPGDRPEHIWSGKLRSSTAQFAQARTVDPLEELHTSILSANTWAKVGTMCGPASCGIA
jgi:aminoglycoside phosphotransferase family enzyme